MCNCLVQANGHDSNGYGNGNGNSNVNGNANGNSEGNGNGNCTERTELSRLATLFSMLKTKCS